MRIWYFLLVFILSSQAFCDEQWVNCIGNQSCQFHLYYAPTTFEELCNHIKYAVSQGYKVRAIGNGYSLSDIGCTHGCLLSLKHLKRILSIDKEKKLVRVEAGISLQELNEQLAMHGLALSNQAAIAEISLGGALSTGVHGTGHTGTLSSFIREIQLVTADGHLHQLSLDSDPDAFSAASLSLGSLGVIYAVTLQCEPLFYLKADHEIQSLESVMENYKMLHHSNDFFHFFWNVEMGQVMIQRWNRCEQKTQQNDSFTQPRASYQVLPWHVIDVNDKELFSEIAIPIDLLPQALEAIKQLVEKYQQLGATMTEVNVRFVEPDRHAYLSPAFDRSVAYIAVWEGERSLAFYQELEDILSLYQGRPHWGKINFLNYEKVVNLYGVNLQKFIHVKRRLDPQEIFSNDFTHRIFGCEK
jgi:FAD/FMN-containing dehydrogenase